ncbi:dihydropteroate synthase [Paenibacillus senegalensis]|uniref:dihydropteroate synthase n=1 Tax=Paenibacillus senegalensis TaxID=1465766 RepID=UPI000289979D|nr:dihydropteroate synthase [Paenibacillus senegalensis]
MYRDIKYPERVLDCGNYQLVLGQKTQIMGILNVTPDSFSDGGRYTDLRAAVERAKQMVAEGADILDIGGESTRPGHTQVSAEEELARVIPVIQLLKEEVSVPISIDTYKAEVARQAIEAGAHIINDVWGGALDPEMAGVAAAKKCPIIVTHNRPNMEYVHFMNDVIGDLQRRVEALKAQGVTDHQIVLDPGIGFAKTYEHNLIMMKYLHQVTALGFPVLLGTSRKRFIQRTLDLPAAEVVEGTAATVVWGIAQGCDIVRVHDVAAIHRTVQMADAIARNPFTAKGD